MLFSAQKSALLQCLQGWVAPGKKSYHKFRWGFWTPWCVEKLKFWLGFFFRGIFRKPSLEKWHIPGNDGAWWTIIYFLMYTMYKYYGWIIKQIIWFMKIAMPKCAKQNYPRMTRTKDDCNRFLQVHSYCVCCNISNQTRLLHISSQGWWQNLSLSVI